MHACVYVCVCVYYVYMILHCAPVHSTHMRAYCFWRQSAHCLQFWGMHACVYVCIMYTWHTIYLYIHIHTYIYTCTCRMLTQTISDDTVAAMTISFLSVHLFSHDYRFTHKSIYIYIYIHTYTHELAICQRRRRGVCIRIHTCIHTYIHVRAGH